MLPSTIRALDYHTAGEPFRIVTDPPVPIPGRTVAERRARAIEDPAVQGLRAVLCSEPRGHADMYGGFIVPPDDQGADLGVLFWHKDGFSTACGHGTIALGVWAVETGRVAAPRTGTVDVVIDVPSGRVTARVHRQDARVIGMITDRDITMRGVADSRNVSQMTVREAMSAEALFCFEDDSDEQAATIRVTGFTSRPEVQRSNRNGMPTDAISTSTALNANWPECRITGSA